MIARLRTLLRNKQVLSLSGSISSSALNFISFAIFARILFPEDLGNWFIFLALFNFFDQLRSGIVHTSLIKFSSGNSPQETQAFNGSALLISLIITLILMAVCFICSYLPFFPETLGMNLFFNWFPAIYLATLPLNFSIWLLQAKQRFDHILYIRLINQGSLLLMVLVHIALGYAIGPNQLIFYYLCAQALSSIVCIAWGWAQLHSLLMAKKTQLLQLVHFGKYSMGTLMGSNLLRSSDTLLIGSFLGPAAVALYGVPQKLLELIEIPLRSFLATAMPQMAQKMNQGELSGVADVMKKYAGTLSLLLLPVVLFALIFAKPLMILLGGENYADSAYLLRIFIIYAAFLPLDRFFGVSLDIINKPALNFSKVMVMLAVNVCGDWLALTYLGEVWAVACVSILTFVSGVSVGHLLLQGSLSYRFTDIWVSGWLECLALSQKAKKLISTR